MTNNPEQKCKDFIRRIPDSKLRTLPTAPTSRVDGLNDPDYRLDMQGLTTGNPKKHNLQVQINRETKDKALKSTMRERYGKGTAVSELLVEVDADMSPDEIRNKLLNALRSFKSTTKIAPQPQNTDGSKPGSIPR